MISCKDLCVNLSSTTPDTADSYILPIYLRHCGETWRTDISRVKEETGDASKEFKRRTCLIANGKQRERAGRRREGY